MKQPQDANDLSGDDQVSLKPTTPSTTSTSHLPPACTPFALLPMPQHTPSECSDPVQCSSPSGGIDHIPGLTPDSPGLPICPSLPCLIEPPPSLHSMCDFSSTYEYALSNLLDAPSPFDAVCPDGAPASCGKGKAKEAPPTLPPLSFSSSGLGCHIGDWSSIPGPSSYCSASTSLRTASSTHSPSNSEEVTVIRANELPILTKVLSRTRSQSNLSTHSTTPSMSKIRIKLAASKTPVNLARKLLSRNRGDVTEPLAAGQANDAADLLGSDVIPIQTRSYLLPRQGKDITRASSPQPGVEMPTASIDTPDVAAILYPDPRQLDGIVDVRGKGRSYSSPFPKTALGVAAQVDFDHSILPLPLHSRDLFDEMLPRELQLRIFFALISLHEADYEQLKSSRKWSVLTACSSKNRWVGRNRAIRELVKLSRVSKSWLTLVFDGQLWQNIDLHCFPATSHSFLALLVEQSGPFIKSLDLSGHTHLSPTALVDLAGDLCVRSTPIANFMYTQLTAITLQGCVALTTQSLHNLLIRSPFIRSLDVKGLRAVTNATFDVLALCPYLTTLNMSRCTNIDGNGLRAFGAAVVRRGAHLALEELRLSGLPLIDDNVLTTLGRAAPRLEVLDLSYCRSLHNSALEAFVSCPKDGSDNDFGETISLTSQQAGRDPRDWRRYKRRVTALRHLSLSNCTMLTDTACSNLAYSVPRLEFLELAGIGHTLKDSGLVHLLLTTPFIRKLDLEDASDITDAVLEVLTPEIEGSRSFKLIEPSQPGHALEHLTVSCATNLTDGAFKALIRACPRLRILEADSTSMSGAVLKDFVRQVCERGTSDAGLVVVDCRSVGERTIKDVVMNTRPRRGWRSWEARKFGYLDGRDGEDLKVGQDECDEKRVVVKSFYSWQTVDAVRHARERKKKANKKTQTASEQMSEPEDGGKLFKKIKWWPQSSGISSGTNTPSVDGDRDGCVVM